MEDGSGTDDNKEAGVCHTARQEHLHNPPPHNPTSTPVPRPFLGLAGTGSFGSATPSRVLRVSCQLSPYYTLMLYFYLISHCSATTKGAGCQLSSTADDSSGRASGAAARTDGPTLPFLARPVTRIAHVVQSERAVAAAVGGALPWVLASRAARQVVPLASLLEPREDVGLSV